MSRTTRGALGGTAVLAAVAVYEYASRGSGSFRAQYRRRRDATPLTLPPRDDVTERDLGRLPEPVATYVRRAGAVGQPRVTHLELNLHGRIRSGPDARWMTFAGQQFSSFGTHPLRLFHLDARFLGLPVDVLHVFDDQGATMRVKALSLLPIVSAAGPEMDRAETVTMFNDLCVLAPSALVDAPVRWEPQGDARVWGAYTQGGTTVAAELLFDDDGDLVDFVSDDRLRAGRDGRSFTRQRWSTPVGGYHRFGACRIAAQGSGRWHAPEPEGEFAYIEVTIDDITYNPRKAGS